MGVPNINPRDFNMLGLQKFFLEWDQINQKTLARPTACTKKTQVRRFLLHTKATEPAQLTYLVVQEYLNFLSDYYSPNTLGNHKASISSFCTYLLRCFDAMGGFVFCRRFVF